MKLLDCVWLVVALLIVAQQVIVRQGEFDPVALGAIALFVGMIPAGRADRKKNDSPEKTIANRARTELKRYLERRDDL